MRPDKDAEGEGEARLVVAVVDDDRSVLAALAALLQSADYAVLLFDSATAMLDSGCVAEIDCMISDVGMPVMDGFELVRAIHAARPELPVILISGRADAIARAGGGVDRCRLLPKPFDGQQLLASLSSALQKSSAPPVGCVGER